MQHDIFISYSTVNSDWAEGVCQLLESNEYTVWMAPRDISPGATWGAEIVRGIQDCRLMLLLLSSASNHSRQVAREVQLADSAQLPIIPVLLEAIKPEGDFVYFLANTQWLTAIGGSPQTHAATLLAAVRPELAKSPDRQTPSSARIDISAMSPHTGVPRSQPEVAGDSGAADQQPPLPASQPISPLSATAAASTPEVSPGFPASGQISAANSSKGPWLWVALGAVVIVAVLCFIFLRKPAAQPTTQIQQTGLIAYNKAEPWAGTYEGDVAKDQIVVHISEESSAGRHDFQITVDNLTTGKQAEKAAEIELGKGEKLTFSLGDPTAPRVRCALELTSDRQSLIGKWTQLKTNPNHPLQVAFNRTSSSAKP